MDVFFAGPDPGRDAKIDESLPKVVIVDPVLHRWVLVVGHEHREREVVQQALGRALPAFLAFTDADQLAGEGQLGHLETELGAD